MYKKYEFASVGNASVRYLSEAALRRQTFYIDAQTWNGVITPHP